MRTITKEQLETLYLNNPNAVVCKRLGVTTPTLLKTLRKHGIPLKGMGNRGTKSKIIVK